MRCRRPAPGRSWLRVPERWIAPDVAGRHCRVSGRQRLSSTAPVGFESRATSALGRGSRPERDHERRCRHAGAAAAAAAARSLAEGGLVALPTETVYGLGADAANARAVARLFAAKDRPSFNPLISHVADLAQARRLARFDPAAARLAAAFWPGPLTLVLPKSDDCPA